MFCEYEFGIWKRGRAIRILGIHVSNSRNSVWYNATTVSKKLQLSKSVIIIFFNLSKRFDNQVNAHVNTKMFRPMYAEESRISEVPVYSPIPYAASAATGQVSRATSENLKGLNHEILEIISFMSSFLNVQNFWNFVILEFSSSTHRDIDATLSKNQRDGI